MQFFGLFGVVSIPSVNCGHLGLDRIARSAILKIQMLGIRILRVSLGVKQTESLERGFFLFYNIFVDPGP